MKTKFLLKSIAKVLSPLMRAAGYDVVLKQQSPIPISKESDRLSYYETKTGNYWLPTDAVNDCIRYAIICNKIFDEPIYREAQKHIKPATVVLDIGSNFGQMAIMYAKKVGKDGLVYAFECQPFIFDILKKNVQANKANVIPIFGAVHNESGKILQCRVINFEHEEQCYGSYGVDYSDNKNKSHKVKTLTIDDMNIDRPISFIKTDVQGGDLFALQGAVKTINKNRMPIIFEYESSLQERYNLKFQEYVDFVKDIGYYFAKVVMPNNFLILPKEKQP